MGQHSGDEKWFISETAQISKLFLLNLWAIRLNSKPRFWFSGIIIITGSETEEKHVWGLRKQGQAGVDIRANIWNSGLRNWVYCARYPLGLSNAVYFLAVKIIIVKKKKKKHNFDRVIEHDNEYLVYYLKIIWLL